MIAYLLEYLFCLVYVISLTIVLIFLSKRKIAFKKILCLGFFYSIINYLLTGTNSLVLQEYMVSNTCIWAFDFVYVSCLLGKFIKKNAFYSSVFNVAYIFSINAYIHLSNLFFGFNRALAMSCSWQRIVMVFAVNILAIVLLIVLKRLKILPGEKLLDHQANLFIIFNFFVLYALMIIFIIGVESLYDLNAFIVVALLVIWILFLKVLSLYIETTIKNEDLLMAKMANQYISKYIDFYRQESENLRKIRHDLKNHQMILESIDKEKKYQQYIDEVFTDVENSDFVISGNIFVDSCLFVKKQEYPQIDFTYDLSIKELVFNDKDLMSLLFNLIDNACKEAMMTDCKVDIVVSYQNDILVIRVTNTVRQKPNFIVNKGEEHGLGLKIINSIVNKYNGVIFIDYPDDKIVFNIKINV